MTKSDSSVDAAAVENFRNKIIGLLAIGDEKAALETAEAVLEHPVLGPHAIGATAAIYHRNGAIGYAIKMLNLLMEREPCAPDVVNTLAVLYCMAGCMSDALYHAKLATSITVAELGIAGYFGPQFPQFSTALEQISAKPLLAMANAALGGGDLDRAQFMVEQHLSVVPNDVEALTTYAQILSQRGELAKAIGMLRSVATLVGPTASLLSSLAHCLMLTGEFHEALACHREAVARAPKSAVILGAAVADLRYFGRAEAEASGILQIWLDQLIAAAPKTVRPPVKYAGAVPVNLCYICTALDDEAMRDMVARIAQAHDRAKVKVIGFGKGEADAPQNQWVRGVFDLWRNVASLDVATMGALIRGEGVHVVIDADGLKAPANSGLYQRNAAPVQISWLNTPVAGRVPGRGLVFTPGTNAAEGEIALAAGRYCLAGPVGAPVVATPAPAASGAPITFGAEVSLAELNPRLAMAWGRILQSVPNAALLFRDTGLFVEQASIDRVAALFGNAGVAHRIDVMQNVGRAEFAANIDIALAPFPAANVLAYGEILRGGAPVVAATHCDGGADLGAFLTAAGLGETLVAADVDAYVAAAIALAGDPDRLRQVRADLPASLASVAAFSPQGFARAIEDSVLAALGQTAS